jgi:hypothetical protein
MMAKLHEIIAVEGGLQTTARKINEETIKTFGRRDEHFVGHTKETKHFADDDAKLDTSESKEMVTTVMDRLLYGTAANVRAMDAYMQKEATNQTAHADLVVDGVMLATQVPAIVLLGLETRITELRAVYEAIPTLAPGPTWELDTDRRKAGGVYRSANPDSTFRTRKTVRPIIMAPATDKHPAQVQAITEDVPVARIVTHHWSGMMTSAQKSDLLGRIDKLLRGLKRARQRANDATLVDRKIGGDIFAYLHGGIVA